MTIPRREEYIQGSDDNYRHQVVVVDSDGAEKGGSSPWKTDDDATQALLATIQTLLAAGLPAALAAGGGLKIEGVTSGVPQPGSSAQPAAVTMQNAAVAIGNGTIYPCVGLSGIVVQVIIAGTATITWEVLPDSATPYPVVGTNLGTGVTATTAAVSGLYWVPTPNVAQLQARISTWVSGAVTAIGRGYYGTPPYVISLLAQGIAGEDLVNGVLATRRGMIHLGRVTADGQIKAGAGYVDSLNINPTTATPTAGLLTVYNSLTETGEILHSEWVFAITPGHTIILNRSFGIGLYVGFDATLTNVSVDVSGY